MAESSTLRDTWREAHALVGGGDLPQARRLLTAAVRDAAIADDPDVLETRRRLAEVHYRLGSPTDARRELEGALASGTASLGEAHPLVLTISARLGAVTEEIGNRYEARRNFSRVARLGPAVLGPTHPAVRLAETYLAKASAPVPAGTPPPAPTSQRAGTPPPASRPRIPAVSAARAGGSPRTRVMIVSAAVAVTLLAGLVAELVVRRHPPASQISPGAPRGVTVRPLGGAVTVTWVDPTRGTAPFIVAGGVAGQPGRLRQQIPAGQTSVTINGLNAALDYCFTVVAVYGTDDLAISDLVCTHRR